jgi:hypothetical protein
MTTLESYPLGYSKGEAKRLIDQGAMLEDLTGRALSHLARKGSRAACCRLAKALNLLNSSPAGTQVMSSKNG